MVFPRLTRSAACAATTTLPARCCFTASIALALLVALPGCDEGTPMPVHGDPTLSGPGLTPLIRPDTPGNNLMFNFDAGDVVETFNSPGGLFVVHFTKDGPNAVPLADNDASGVPDFVEEVASVYDEIEPFYATTLGFRPPESDGAITDNGGDDRFDVYLVDFAGQGDGHYSNDKCTAQNSEICAGYMVQENDYKGYGYPSTLVANRILGSHEFFHAVQAAYDTGQGSVVSEGTAVWATEKYDPTLKDFESFLKGYFDNTDRPIDTPLPGPVDPFSYGSAIFFWYLDEHVSPNAVRKLWEKCENGAGGVANPDWFAVLPEVLNEEAGLTFADAFTDFATRNLFTGGFADPTRGYANGAGYSGVKMTPVTAPFTDDEIRMFYASAQYYRADVAARTEMTAALVADPDVPEEVDGLRLVLAVQRAGDYDPLVTVADVSAGTETIDTNGADRLVVLVVNTATGGDSKKPGLCIGTPEEVALCVSTLSAGQGGTGGTGGAGGTAGTAGNGGSGGGGGAEGPPNASCGCSIPGEASFKGFGVIAGAALFGAAQMRRRRRAIKPTIAKPAATRAKP